MKKIFCFLLILFCLIVAGAGVLIAVLDLNRYKSFAVGKIEQNLGVPAQIGSVALSWRSGIGVEIKNLADFEGRAQGLAWENISRSLEGRRENSSATDLVKGFLGKISS